MPSPVMSFGPHIFVGIEFGFYDKMNECVYVIDVIGDNMS
jgi:hypothetical protein